MNGRNMPHIHCPGCTMGDAERRPSKWDNSCFYPPLSKNQTISDWSIYSGDFTPVHLECESGSFSSFGDRRHKISLWRRDQVIRFGYLPPENGFNFKKMNFYVQNQPSRPTISAVFKQRKIFSFSKFFRCLDEKKAAATPWLISFAQIRSEHVFLIKTKSRNVPPPPPKARLG